MSERLPRQQRLRGRKVFSELSQAGPFTRGKYIDLKSLQNLDLNSKPAIGLIVSRRVSLLATKRNRWKRMLREIFRRAQDKVQRGRSLLVRVRQGHDHLPNMQELSQDFLALLKRTGNLK